MSTVRLTLPSGPIPGALYESPGFLLAWLSDRLVARYVAALAELDMRPAHHAVLVALADLEPVRQARLRERLRVDHATFVATVNALAARGLLARDADPLDRRTLLVRLAPSGRDLLDRVEDATRRIEDEEFSALTPRARAQLTRALATVVRDLSTRALEERVA